MNYVSAYWLGYVGMVGRNTFVFWWRMRSGKGMRRFEGLVVLLGEERSRVAIAALGMLEIYVLSFAWPWQLLWLLDAGNDRDQGKPGGSNGGGRRRGDKKLRDRLRPVPSPSS